MGLFGKKSRQEQVGESPQELTDKMTTAMVNNFVEPALTAAGRTELLPALLAAISRLSWEAVTTENVALLQIIQRVCASYGAAAKDELTVDEWGEWMFDDTALVKDQREEFLSRGQQSLERDLSLLSTTQMHLLERSPKYEPLMLAIQKAARNYLASNDGT